MLYRTKCALIVLGDRVEKGHVVELNDAQAAPLINDLIVVGSGPVREDVVEETEKSLDDMTRQELAEKADAEGLSSKGTKADLIERLTLHYQGSNEE